MSKKGYQGESAKDRATNIMDKFIQRNDQRKERTETKSFFRKDPNVPFELWPLQDQIDYYENMSDSDKFDRKYTSYGTWLNEVKEKSGLYPITFTDFTAKHKPYLKELFDDKIEPRAAVRKLEQQGII